MEGLVTHSNQTKGKSKREITRIIHELFLKNLSQLCSRSLPMCFCAFRSPKTWTLNSETHFSINRQPKISHRVSKSGPEMRKTRPDEPEIGARFYQIGARFFKKVGHSIVAKISARTHEIGARFVQCSSGLKSSFLSAFSLNILMNYLKNTWKSVYKTSNDRVSSQPQTCIVACPQGTH